eukprot:scaffold27153_cov33-Tisochrysis_lutea.AAC.1
MGASVIASLHGVRDASHGRGASEPDTAVSDACHLSIKWSLAKSNPRKSISPRGNRKVRVHSYILDRCVWTVARGRGAVVQRRQITSLCTTDEC